MISLPQENLDQILKDIDQALEDHQGPAYAAFDADGTLWNMDMSEHFFKYQVRKNLVPNLPESPWEFYLKMNRENPRKGYLWLAQINQNFLIETVRGWAQDFLDDLGEVPTLDVQRQIMEHLRKNSVEIFIVTASVKWAVEPGAALYYVDHDHVIGVSTKIIDGIVTTEQEGPITWKEGKVEGLLQKTNNVRPIFASGNTNGDLPLLESSTHVRFVVSAAVEGEHTFETEQKLLSLAVEKNWHHHSFN